MLNRTSIEEANKHLQALYGRVSELEGIAQEQHDALLAKDSFIQTKIQELSRQDIMIQDLKNKLQDKDELLKAKKEEIEQLNYDLNVKAKELSILNQRNKGLNDFMKLAPELKLVMTQLDAVVEYVNDIEDYGYADTNESPIDGGYVSTVHNKNDTSLESYNNSNIEDAKLSNARDSNSVREQRSEDEITRYGRGELALSEVSDTVKDTNIVLPSQTCALNGYYSNSDMKQVSDRISKFSVSEDSDSEERKVAINTSGQKEVYF